MRSATSCGTLAPGWHWKVSNLVQGTDHIHESIDLNAAAELIPVVAAIAALADHKPYPRRRTSAGMRPTGSPRWRQSWIGRQSCEPD